MSKHLTALLGLPILAFALSAPAHAQRMGEASQPQSYSEWKQEKADRDAAKEQRRAASAPRPAAYGDHSGGVGNGAGSSENLGSDHPGGGVNSSGSGTGRP